MEKALTFVDTTIGKKVVMALSGLVLFGFVIGHMISNLQVFLGPKVLNNYAVTLHTTLPLLWGTRILLLVSVVLHIAMAVQLTARTTAARPVEYKKTTRARTNFASLTMMLSGVTLLLFILYHLAHFTFPGVAMGAYEHRPYSQVYANFVNGFSIPWVVAIYIAAMISLGMHLYHGSYSLFQTLGLSHPRRNAAAKQVAQFLALTVTVGNVILPLSVLLGLVR